MSRRALSLAALALALLVKPSGAHEARVLGILQPPAKLAAAAHWTSRGSVHYITLRRSTMLNGRWPGALGGQSDVLSLVSMDPSTLKVTVLMSDSAHDFLCTGSFGAVGGGRYYTLLQPPNTSGIHLGSFGLGTFTFPALFSGRSFSLTHGLTRLRYAAREEGCAAASHHRRRRVPRRRPGGCRRGRRRPVRRRPLSLSGSARRACDGRSSACCRYFVRLDAATGKPALKTVLGQNVTLSEDATAVDPSSKTL